jgi:hypothetical protein
MFEWNLKGYVAESILIQTDRGENLRWKHRSLIIHPSLSVGGKWTVTPSQRLA